MDPATQAWADQSDAEMATIVRKHGWFIQYVGGDSCARPGCQCIGDDGPPFAYTVGLFGLAHPELLIFGIDPRTAAGVLNDLGKRVRAGEALLPGQIVEFDAWPHRIVPELVPNPHEILFAANAFYQRPDGYPVPALQLSYDDLNGLFPWEAGYAAPDMQPRPGTFRA